MAEITRCDGVLFKRALLGSFASLREHRDKVNELNVFPVPDGDTGTNMLLTVESAIAEMGEADDHDLSRVAHRVAHGSLMGARGNSGVILSQILRGFAQGVGDQVSVDCRQLAHAFEEATSVAYRGVAKPTEGTILTVARAASEAAQKEAARTSDIAELITIVVTAAQRAVDETPSQLAVLREAGVVDAGGYGLMVILEGFLKTVSGEELRGLGRTRAPASAAAMAGVEGRRVGAHALETPDEGWGFCTEFIIDKPKVGFEHVRETLSAMGESAVIVGDDALVRVHIHTHDPGHLIARATEFGQLLRLKVEDMTRQHHEILAQPPAEAETATAATAAAAAATNGGRAVGIGVVAVCAGEGFKRIFEDMGATVVEGGQSMNPATEDLLQAVERSPAEGVIILPNNKNVILSAEQVKSLADKPITVVPSKTVPQGISALLNLNPEASMAENVESMSHALQGVQTVEVTTAVRSSSLNGLKIKHGDTIALVNGKVTQAGKAAEEVIDMALESLTPDRYGLCTLYAGAAVDEQQLQQMAEHLRQRFSNLEIEVQRGEQEHYPYILSIE